MEYSVASANNAYGLIFFTLPHVLIGFSLLAAGVAGKPILRGAKSKASLFIQIPAGALFFGVGIFAIANAGIATKECREALARGDYEQISGKVDIVRRFAKPGAGHLRFIVGDQVFQTNEDGISGECGFVTPLGKKVRLEQDMNVELKAWHGVVLALKVLG